MNNKVIIGTVAMDTMVEMNVTSVITVTSMPSFRQKMVPYVATGMAMTGLS